VANNVNTNSLSAPPRWSWWVLGMTALGIFLLLTPKGCLDSETLVTSSSLYRVLECVTYDDDYDELPLVRWIYLAIPPTDDPSDVCWTKYQVRPYRAPGFLFFVDGSIEVQRAYADGEFSDVELFDPLIKKIDTKRVSGVRFRNYGSDTIHVKIQLW